MKYVVWGLVLLLVVLHQDEWLWEDSTLVFGFLPVSLLYHGLLSIAAAVTWWLATKFAWPELEPETAVSDADGDAGA